MAYFKCKNCGSLMDEYEGTVTVVEFHPEVDSGQLEYLDYLQCIYCGCNDLEEVTGTEEE